MWKLMTDNAIDSDERRELSSFVRWSSKLTQGRMVKQFEKEWSKWLGCKYSVFVNSGSSANLLIVRALSDREDLWVAQSCTWSTAVSPIMQLSNLQLCDIDLHNFGPDLKNLEHIFKTKKPRFLHLTHLLGFPAITNDLLDLCAEYAVTIVEDCCESHGAHFNNKKVGTHGIASSFSFYYGHHMTTIEGGMICTDDKDLYHELLLLRSHGLLRELPEKEQQKRKTDRVDPLFTFVRDGFNVRGTDIHANLGLMQLPKLDGFIEQRNRNFNTFIDNLDPDKYYKDFNLEGISNFAFPIFSKTVNINSVKELLSNMDIEYRPCIAGNLYEHPFMDCIDQERYDINSQKIHENCVYVGNHKDVSCPMIKNLCEGLNSL
jgi:CDP-6-deoxy-D-xylo-4-hexulose-3-dehydrase